jgi:hypothetical protein
LCCSTIGWRRGERREGREERGEEVEEEEEEDFRAVPAGSEWFCQSSRVSGKKSCSYVSHRVMINLELLA